MPETGSRNLITDVAGLRVGNASHDRIATGVTVLTGDRTFVAGVHVMGGAPGTRETDLLAPDRTVQEVDALVLSGGSAFGLDAASGVADALAETGRGFAVGPHLVPIVPGAILFDLQEDGRWEENPYKALGRAALEGAIEDFALGRVGAGTGATTATARGGLGSASQVVPGGGVVGALIAVNALGSALVEDGPHYWAAPWEIGDEFGGHGVAPSYPSEIRTKIGALGGNTTIGIVATDAALTQAEATRMAVAAHDGLARAIVPAHTPLDGDLIFAAATGTGPRPDGPVEMAVLCHAAATCVARAVARGVFEAIRG